MTADHACHTRRRPPLRHGVRAVLLAVAAVILAGCTARVEDSPALLLVHGAGQTGIAGAACAKPLVVEVLGPRRKGLLGGKGTRRPVPGVAIHFQPLDPESGLHTSTPSMVTDAAGVARTTITLGRTFGDEYLRIFCPDYPNLTEVVRFTTGVKIRGDWQETIAGEALPAPIQLTLSDAENRPLAGVPVYFSLASAAGRAAQLQVTQGVSDRFGIVEARLTTDSTVTGRYEIIAEVNDPQRNLSARGLRVTALALNRWNLLTGVLGGLGIFILGMKLMSEGLQQIAGDRLKSILHFFTRNRFSAVFAGLVVTGMVQSSSACTVMVVGFVNAGLLALHQAIGIIYGAAIGTTVTAQMVSFKLDGLSLPAISVGVAIYLFARRSKTRGAGQALLGFGFLFFGMSMMSTELTAIADFPSFARVFHLFDCRPLEIGGRMPLGPVLGAIGVGTLMTVIVQSSSATIGLAIVLANAGLIDFYTAVPLILGDNIGTTITAILASIGTNRPARQAAIAHTIFKVSGAAVMVILFYVPVSGTPVFLHIVDRFTAGNVFAAMPENIGRHVAAAHTLFNVLCVLLFLPFVSTMARVCRFFVPDHAEDSGSVQYLEPHLLATPHIAVQQSITAVATMAQDAWQLVDHALHAFAERDLRKRDALLEQENAIDRMQQDIIQYLVELTRQPLNEQQSQAIPLLMHCVNDAERIGDHATNIIELAELMSTVKGDLSDVALAELKAIVNVLSEQAQIVIDGLAIGGDVGKALKLEGEIDILTRRAERNHEKRLRKGDCTVRRGIIFVELIGNLERIADHFTNIAERIPEIQRHRLDLVRGGVPAAPSPPLATALDEQKPAAPGKPERKKKSGKDNPRGYRA